MLVAIFSIFFGIIILTWSADQFVNGAANTAKYFNISPMLIGLTIVSIGTSAPEIFVSATAAFQDKANLAIGNAIGSNIANIGLVLGASALILPISIKSTLVKRELPILLVVSILVGASLLDSHLSRLTGFLSLGGLLVVLYTFFHWQKQESALNNNSLKIEPTKKQISVTKACLQIIIGLTLLLLSSHILVWGAVYLANFFGISDLVIGLTIIAAGTSLPELAASITSIKKGHHDIALGNVIGSNIFNLLIVLAMPSLFKPGYIDSNIVYQDYPVMLWLTIFIIAFCHFSRSQKIGRVAGFLLLLNYITYTVWLLFR